jgi:hypothetical protein
MPSNLIYRIKHASESTLSMYNPENIPASVYSQLSETGYLIESDKNILPGTCAYLTKVSVAGSWKYYCGIKRWTVRYDLAASDTRIPNSTQTGEFEGRVSGALRVEDPLIDPSIPRDYFICKYCNAGNAEPTKQGIAGQELVEFPMCNCYSPRGGMAISMFDGAVQGNIATGFAQPEGKEDFPNVYNIWDTFSRSTQSGPSFAGPIPKYVGQQLSKKFPARPGRLGMVYLMLNARATVVPCCWWKGMRPIIFTPSMFRAIDLAVAQAAVLGDKIPGAFRKVSRKPGMSDLVDYIFKSGDYFIAGMTIPYTDGTQDVLSETDAYQLNAMFGRNYDPSLPECGNNHRVIYTLTDSLITPSKRIDPYDKNDTTCSPVWHTAREGSPFSPKNCGNPDCSVRYTWGHTCNGGGAFSLVDGRACPSYENPLMGTFESKRYAKLENMYAGDSVTAAAILELMWLSKGGLPWTVEEWKDTWLVPRIWTTVPFNPAWKQTNKIVNDNGDIITSETWHAEYEVYARKAEINPEDGKISLAPMRKLPGGSAVSFNRKPDGTKKDGNQVPDIPTLVKNVDLKTTGNLKIIWPISDLSLLKLDVTDTKTYAESLKKLKDKAYLKMVWSRDGLKTQVVGQVTKGQYLSGVFCINTAFVQNDTWNRDKITLEQGLLDLKGGDPAIQKLLRQLWADIYRSYSPGGQPVLKNMALLQTSVDERGKFIFEDVPLSTLDNPNHIIVFGFGSASKVDADIIKIKPTFRHGYTYQSNTHLVTSWKSVWNGRPSLFVSQAALNKISTPVSAGKIELGTAIKIGDWYFSSVTGDYMPTEDAISLQISYLKSDIQTLQASLSGPVTKIDGKYYAAVTGDPLSEADAAKLLEAASGPRSFIVSQILQKNKAIDIAKGELSKTKAKLQLEIAQVNINDPEYIVKALKEIDNNIAEIDTDIKTMEANRETYSKDGNITMVSLLDASIIQRQKDKESIQKIRDNLASRQPKEPEPSPPDQSKSDIKAEVYSWVDLSKYTGKGDSDNKDVGVAAKDESSERLYIPYLSPDKADFKDVDKYTKLLPPGSQPEDITLTIPEQSGTTEWRNFIVNQGGKQAEDTVPWYSFPGKATKKIIVYSTRESDSGSTPTAQAGQVKGAKINDNICKWYRTSSCTSMIIIAMNPEICHQSSEFMIFSMYGKIKQKYNDADGKQMEKEKIIKFIPMNYSQVKRPFPGYTKDKAVVNIGTESKNEVQYQKIQITTDIEILERKESARHPWIFFVVPVAEEVDVKEWRYYNDMWYPPLKGASPITIPDHDELEIYMEYAYIADIYDEHEADAKYMWEKEGNYYKKETRIMFSSPKSGIMRTLFRYEPAEDKVDGYDKVPMGTCSMATVWPHAKYACRDYEIMYIWRDTYPGEELTTGNMKNRTMTNSAASKVACKTKGKDQMFTMVDQGDHDLGTEFQPSLQYNTRTSTNVQGGTPRFQMTRAEWSSTFTQKADAAIVNRDPTFGFPKSSNTLNMPPDNPGALYYPYTRGEPSSVYVPRHNGYPWEFMDKWRNKPKEAENLGAFRMQASDWCIRGTDVTRVRTWSRHWIYDEKRETQFIGRSKTRGPVFQLEYREYYDVPTKTVFLKPYVANTASAPDQCYCSLCNRYFARDVCFDSKSPQPCPLCNKYSDYNSDPPTAPSITRKSGWKADWMYLVDRQESETPDIPVETLSEGEKDVFVIKDPSRQDYDEWKTKVETLFQQWSGDQTNATLETNLKKEQARGRLRGWIANFTGGLSFLNEEESRKLDSAQQQVQSIEDKSEIDILTGVDKYGLKKRKDLGAFQISDQYVPGSIDPYYGSDPNSSEEMKYKELEDAARKAESAAAAAKGDAARYESKQKILDANPQSTFSEGGSVYSADGRATYTSRGAPTNKISDKVDEAKKIQSEKEDEAAALRSKVNEFNSRSARGQARDALATKTQEARTKLEKTCNRYYEYQQTAFGYNYPWSPFDSPPLFGNMGREMFSIELCTIGSVISWLPRADGKSKETPSFPAIPSWWTSATPSGQPREMVTLLAPPIECTRALIPMASEAINPFYYYIMTEDPFREEGPTEGGGEELKSIPTKDVRIVTQYDPVLCGQPYTRSDAGRFTLSIKADVPLCRITVVGDSASYYDSQDNILLEVTGFAEEKKLLTVSKAKPDPYLSGSDVKGFAVADKDIISVGNRYPGFYGSYNYGKTFVGFKKPTGADSAVHWAWPEDVRDKITRAKKILKWYPELMDPMPVIPADTEKLAIESILKEYYSRPIKTKQDSVDDTGLWSISSIMCGPYSKKKDNMDDGREVSCGPNLKEDGSNSKNEKEKKFLKTYFAIVAESERIDNDGKMRPPLMWVRKLSDANLGTIIDYKVPSEADSEVPHAVYHSGSIVPVELEKGDEDDKDEYGKPAYRGVFSTGEIIFKDAGLGLKNPTGGANLLTSSNMNAAGYYPGFIIGNVNYRTLGKIFEEREFQGTEYHSRIDKKISSGGQNEHSLSGNFSLPRFNSDALFLEITLDSWFSESNLSDYLHNATDSMSLEVSIAAAAVPGGNPLSTSNVTFNTSLPVIPDTGEKDMKVKYFLDFGTSFDLSITFKWWVKTDPGNFYQGLWKGSETKVEMKDQYDRDGKLSSQKLETVPNPDNFCYLDNLISSIKIGVLSPGKCAELVEVEEVGFYVSTGSKCELEVSGKEYDFFTEQDQDWYKPNWEDFDKKLERTEGWWKDSGRYTAEDTTGAGVDESWFVKAEEQMYTSMREEEEKTLKDPSGQSKKSLLGKVPKAEIFPRAGVEVPELPLSRLKMIAWNAINQGETPDARVYPYNWDPAEKEKSWMWGGVWTTRMAGPEWITTSGADKYPTRDYIWWPALPYKAGKVILKGRYFITGDQYKDESKAINKKKYRGVESKDDDKYNEYAYKYEVRGFDALLKMIQTVEQGGAEDRRSAAMGREFGTSYAQKQNTLKSLNNSGWEKTPLSARGTQGSLGGAYSRTLAGGDVGASRDYAEQMANAAQQGIYNSIQNSMRGRVNDQRNWVFLDQINMKIDEVNWEDIKNREGYQEEIFEEARKLEAKDFSNSRFKFTAIIPYHDWNEIMDITGANLKKDQKFESRGGDEASPITVSELKEIKDEDCHIEWYGWEWKEVSSFSFRNEYDDRYPLKASTTDTKWKTLLVRKCGSKWAHKDTEVDGGKIWTGKEEELVGKREHLKKNHPLIVQVDCADMSSKKSQQTIDPTKADASYTDTTDDSKYSCIRLAQKWEPGGEAIWPKTVSNDGGKTFNWPDPWWRF